MCLVGRACNIFPLSILLNYFREHKITKKMQFIMWFSGLRGAIAFALSLNLPFDNETRHIIVTSTLILVLFTTLVLGGSTLPLMKFLNADKNNRRQRKKYIFLSKTKEMGETVDLLDLFGEESGNQQGKMDNNENDLANSVNIHIVRSGIRLRGFAKLDQTILKPFFTRKFTDEELRDGQSAMNKLTKQWFDDANQDANTSRNSSGESSVYFKKPSTNGNKIKTTLDNKVYQNLNSTVLLDSTENEDDNDEDEEELVIDRSNLILNKK